MTARKLVFLASLFAAAAAQATPQTDLAALRRLRTSAKAGSALAATLDDVLAVAPKVEEWVPQTTSGSARQRFDANHRLTGYTIYYQSNSPSEQERIANMAHEMMHAAVNEAHHKDFVNYGNPPDMGKTVPAAAYAQSGTIWALENAAARQTAQINTSAQTALVAKAQALHALIATSGYTTAQQGALNTKAIYAASSANSEYDASLTSMIVFCANWGVKTTTPFYKKLEELTSEAHLRRTHNARQ
jgi:hypothetical protein